MKWETIEKMKAFRGLLFLAVAVGAIIYKLVTEGFTIHNILILGGAAVITIFVVVILRFMRREKE